MLERMQPEAFEQVFSIMERSFPADEYRTYEEQKELLFEPRYHIYVCMRQDPDHACVEAFLSVWQLEDFTYIEHLASDPAIRGQGLGSAILQEAFRMFPNNLQHCRPDLRPSPKPQNITLRKNPISQSRCCCKKYQPNP